MGGGAEITIAIALNDFARVEVLSASEWLREQALPILYPAAQMIGLRQDLIRYAITMRQRGAVTLIDCFWHNFILATDKMELRDIGQFSGVLRRVKRGVER